MKKQQWFTNPAAPGIQARNPFTVDGDVVQMQLTQDQVALIDLADLSLVAGHRWNAHKNRQIFYAATHIPNGKGKRKYIEMHRMVCQISPERPCVDHTNHNGLDNRRSNLRASNVQENRLNSVPDRGSSSRFKGVCWGKDKSKWTAQIKVNGNQCNLGAFDCETCAAKAYDAAAREHFGSFAHLNFPE